jgi:hypothetical protein
MDGRLHLILVADGKIAQLEDKSAKASGDAKAQYEKEIKALKASRDKASAKLAEVEKSSASRPGTTRRRVSRTPTSSCTKPTAWRRCSSNRSGRPGVRRAPGAAGSGR